MTFGFLDVHLSTDYIIISDYSQSVALEPEQDVEHMDHIWRWIALRPIVKHRPLVFSSEDGLISCCHQRQSVVDTTVFDILEIRSPGKHVVMYRSSTFHSASGPVLIPTWGHAGQNKAKSPSPVLSGRSWATPAQILLCWSLHCRDIRRSSWYWSYMLLWVGMDMAKYWNTHRNIVRKCLVTDPSNLAHKIHCCRFAF